MTSEAVGLLPYKIIYLNSSGNVSGEIEFGNYVLIEDRLVLGFAKSPQYEEYANSPYNYNFGSSGLASTAGRLLLYFDDELIDDFCWGKLCENSYEKFSTKAEDNYSWIRDEGEYRQEKYYPDINPEAIVADVDEDYVDCDGIIISEIFSYYIESQNEQFIELYNPTDEEIKIDYCSIRFKGKDYSLSGEIAPKTYLDYRNEKLVLTKNPTSSLEIEITNTNGDTIDVVEYEHGQRKDVSLALFDNE